MYYKIWKIEYYTFNNFRTLHNVNWYQKTHGFHTHWNHTDCEYRKNPEWCKLTANLSNQYKQFYLKHKIFCRFHIFIVNKNRRKLVKKIQKHWEILFYREIECVKTNLMRYVLEDRAQILKIELRFPLSNSITDNFQISICSNR